MKYALSVAAAFVFGSSAAVASPAMDKCLADTTALGAKDPEAQCACFVEALPADEVDAYASIGDWASEASAAMKEAGAQCFPELQ